MRTKREMLERFAEYGNCEDIYCSKCPYQIHSNKCPKLNLKRIGAMAILRQNRKKEEPQVFDESRILTCVTADQAKVGMRGYFSDSVADLESQFNENNIHTLLEIRYKKECTRFLNRGCSWALFYPIDEGDESEEVEELKRVFDKSKILTCVTADKSRVGMKGYFANDLIGLESEFYNNNFHELTGIAEKKYACRFEFNKCHYALFYPIEEVDE